MKADPCGPGDGEGRGWRSAPRLRWRADDGADAGARDLPVEAPVAIVHDASTYAVMMATPLDLEDFAIGLSLTEGVITGPGEVEGFEAVEGPQGWEARMWLKPERRSALQTRRRRMAGPTGCGLCGLDSLAEAVRSPRRVEARLEVCADDLLAITQDLDAHQPLGRRTRAAHAAGFWSPESGLETVREDVGRHNALDKLAGALARRERGGAAGAVVLTSRVSVEMVQKTAAIGAEMLVAVSAPTTLALATAEAAGITLVAVARADGFEVFCHPGRVRL